MKIDLPLVGAKGPIHGKRCPKKPTKNGLMHLRLPMVSVRAQRCKGTAQRGASTDRQLEAVMWDALIRLCIAIISGEAAHADGTIAHMYTKPGYGSTSHTLVCRGLPHGPVLHAQAGSQGATQASSQG